MHAWGAYTVGMKDMATIQYTLRGIPRRVDQALRRKAREEGSSLNQAAIQAIARSLGLAEEKPVYHDLDDLAGTWVEDPAFDEAIREMDTVDADLWR